MGNSLLAVRDINHKYIVVERLKKILVDWFHYDGQEDKSFFIYDEHWGTLYYKQSEFGANTSIADHHFTYGYFVFGASVLSNYDSDFYNSYKGMIEMLIRDYGNYSENDREFCKFRNYDMYEGHSWAGGYANNDSGNNQESASEALFSWVGMYLWGIVSENNSYRDAGAFGFTTEMEAVKQYWFNYDKDNWVSDYPYQVVSQVYGGTNFFGTFFGGQPLYCYGIHWLPVGEYLTAYGMEQKRCAEIYQGLWNDTETAIQKSQLSAKNKGSSKEEIEAIRKNYKTPDNGWQHVTWSYLSMTDPLLAIHKFSDNWNLVQKTDQANTYWYINSMLESGHKTEKICATGSIASTVYYNDSTKQYTAMAWNPTNKKQTVKYYDSNRILGQATVDAHSLIRFIIPSKEDFSIDQAEAPNFNIRGFYDNRVEKNVSGTVTYDDNRYVEITCGDSSAQIHYTTDGTIPTVHSPVYTKPILVSDNVVIKAFVHKEGCIDSSYQSVDITIQGTEVTDTENIALGKNVVVSSEEGKSTPGKNITDGNTNSRWSSKFTDDQWCYVDLGDKYPINTVVINWQNSYGKKYEIQVSDDGTDWRTVASVENYQSGIRSTTFDAIYARYVKMKGINRSTIYGYSIWEMEIYAARIAEVPEIIVEKMSNGKKQVTMTTAVKGALIRYTLDGSVPDENSLIYTGPIEINSTSTIKAITYRKGMVHSSVAEKNVVKEPTEETVTKSQVEDQEETGTEFWTEETTTALKTEETFRESKKETTIENNDSTDKFESENVSDMIPIKEITTKEREEAVLTGKIKIVVPKATIKKVKRKKTGTKIKVSLKKIKSACGYQIKISTTKKFKKKTTIIKNFKTYQFTVKRLKKNKKYYIKARAYIIRNREKYFGKWSGKKRIK